MASRRDALVFRVRTQKLPTLLIADARLKEPDLSGLLDEAILSYGRVRPYRVRFDWPGDGTTIKVPLPDGTLYSQAPAWVPGTSGILAAELVGSNETTPTPLTEMDDFVLWPRGVSIPTHLLLVNGTVGVGTTLRVVYGVPQSITDAVSTVPLPDEEILANLLARLACLALAGAVAEAKDNLIVGDAINYRDLAQRFQALAKGFGQLLPPAFQSTFDGAKAGDAAVVAASGWIDWDTHDAVGLPLLWHGSRVR